MLTFAKIMVTFVKIMVTFVKIMVTFVKIIMNYVNFNVFLDVTLKRWKDLVFSSS